MDSVLSSSHFQNNGCLEKFIQVSKINKNAGSKNSAHLHGPRPEATAKQIQINRLLQI